jgi:hypothetical protein
MGSYGVPRSRRRRDIGALRVPMLAGWLFADLFLVLFIVAFSSQPAVPVPVPTPTLGVAHSASPSPSPTPSPTPTPTPSPVGLDQNPYNPTIDVSPGAVDNPATRAAALKQLITDLNNWLSGHHLLGRTAGFVIIFATSVTGAGDPVDEAYSVANSVLPVLRKQDAAMFGRTSGEGLWGGSSGNDFHFQIFFFTK